MSILGERFHHLLLRVWRNHFVRNVTVMASGTAGAQVITLAFSPLITRIYGPEAFGLLGTFMAILTVSIPVAALTYPIAIVLPKHDKDAVGLVRLSFILSFVVAFFTAILFCVSGNWLTRQLGIEAIDNYLLVIPLAMFFAASVQICQQWLVRKKEFSIIARIAVIHSFILNTAKTGIGWFNPIGAVLIILATVGHALHATMLFVGARRRYMMTSESSRGDSKAEIKALARRHSDFPLYRAPQNFINAVSQSLPILMLAAFFGPTAAGFYTLSKMVMGMPSTLLGKAVSDVFYPRITEAARNDENLPKLIKQATATLLIVGIVPFGLVVIFGPFFFSLIFGGDWVLAGEYARWLALFFLFNFINKPCVAAVPVLGIQRGLLIYEFFSTGVKTIGLIAGFIYFESQIWAVALFSIMGMLAYGAMMMWIYTHAKKWYSNGKTS